MEKVKEKISDNQKYYIKRIVPILVILLIEILFGLLLISMSQHTANMHDDPPLTVWLLPMVSIILMVKGTLQLIKKVICKAIIFFCSAGWGLYVVYICLTRTCQHCVT